MNNEQIRRVRQMGVGALGISATALVAAVLAGGAAQAANFDVGEVSIETQVTVSAGFGIRTEDRDSRLVCAQNNPGGSGIPSTTCNVDDGNLNFNKGDFVYAPIRVQGEATASWQNFTAYIRGQAFYDTVYDNGDFARNGGVNNYRDLNGRQTDAARNASYLGYELMDAWVRGQFDIGDQQLTLKFGQQTISWGEALFSPLSLVQVNSLDQAKLRLPGAELRDAVRSMPAAFVQYDVGGGLGVEAFYQFAFRSSRSDPAGSFFSTTDVGGRGGVGTGLSQDYDVSLASGAGGLSVQRSLEGSTENSNGRNFGAALRYFSPELNNTEFGLYFANVTARSPVPTFRVASTLLPLSAFPGSPATSVAVNINNSRVMLVNPQDVQMLGASFNTSIDSLGLSVAGEATWMHDQPILVDGETVATTLVCAATNPGARVPCAAVGRANQWSAVNGWTANMPGLQIDGFTREDVYTFMLRGLKQFGASDAPSRLFGSNSTTAIVEFGGVYVDLPDKSILAYDAPGNGTGGDGTATDPVTSKYEPATDFSLGVTATVVASYPDALFGANLTPSIRYQAGLVGNTPMTGGYVENASALTFQLDADYLLAWRGSIGYTSYFGGGRQNLLLDRDFFQMSVSYSF
ncbi:DUF1302 domain-containing protein [Zavarzinia compransoris]|uniref:DUF1302 domain-containing protein n=1 Tax=Zavarzinia compransoris TaxID=1264899 RepID=UPI0010EF91DB|nr:DUF1302 family protein [Zavarzinia compransoris]TDP43823.1 uncharacterized protein DUF1302 [Zavarzinia compransoris]